MDRKLPISVLIMAKNEAQALPRCLSALSGFEDVIVVDSHSKDGTAQIAQDYGARAEQFSWNGKYPRKTQWALDNLATKHDWVFLVDADEIIPQELITELRSLDFSCAGYFVRGLYLWQGKPLQHGLQNNKLCLFDKTRMTYPEIDDLDLTGGWEMEMHYQPVLKNGGAGEKTGQLRTPLFHDACQDKQSWLDKHKFYAAWEAGMILREGFPEDPSKTRELMKKFFRRMKLRSVIAFLHSYVFKRGFLDGAAGLDFALCRARYYQMVAAALSSMKKQNAQSSSEMASI